MHSSETMALAETAPQDESQEPVPETRPEQQREFDPSAEQVTKTFEGLGLMSEELPNEDPRLEFIVSLSVDQEKYLESVRRQKANYDARQNQAGPKKLARIFALRKLVLGYDERAEEAVNRAYDYINTRINKVAEKLKDLLEEQPQRAEIREKTEQQKESLRWLSKHRRNLEWLMASGYPELWQKLRQPEETRDAGEGPTNELTAEDIEALTREVDPGSSRLAQEIEEIEAQERVAGQEAALDEETPGQAEAEPEKSEEAETEEDKEKTRRERLALVLGRELGDKHPQVAPEVVQLLSDWGFSSVEAVFQKREKGQQVDYVRTTVFVDPQSPRLKEEMKQVIAKSTFDRGERSFTAVFKRLATDPKIPLLVKNALSQLTDNYRLRFPEQEQAGDILKFLNAREERPYAMYANHGAFDRWNLVSIEKSSKHILTHHQDEQKVPEYRDNTLFFSSPVLTMETRASEFQN